MNLHQVELGLLPTLTRCTTGLSLKRWGSRLLRHGLSMVRLSSACLALLVTGWQDGVKGLSPVNRIESHTLFPRHDLPSTGTAS